MGGVEVKVSLDAKQFVDQLEGAATKMLSSLASAVNKSARAARKASIKSMSADIGRPAADFKDATPVIQRASPSNLRATFTAKTKRMGVLGVGTFTPVMSRYRGSFVGSTERLTGGGSLRASTFPRVCHAEKHQQAGSNGTVDRTAKGKGGLHAVMIEHPRTALSQDHSVPRKVWERVANEEATKDISEAVGRVINGMSATNNEGSD